MKIPNRNRKSCPVCSSTKVQTLHRSEKIPVYFGCNSTEESPLTCSQTFMHCSECSCIYIKELIDPNILYAHNHNVDIVGNTWKQHYNLFYNFISHDIIAECSVLEVGDPSAKLAIKCKMDNRYKSWTIIEPSKNISKVDGGKINFINDWIENIDFSDTKFDIIVMSHVFEHLHDPKKIFDLLYSNTEYNTKIFLSIPNLEDILKNKKLSPAGLHFEHTFYYDIEMLEVFFKQSGWYINRLESYVNHSYFLELVKGHPVNGIFEIKQNNVGNFMATINILNKNIHKINKKIRNTKQPVYLFGAHIQSQIMLSSGINESDIVSILDNATHKHGKKLYGTNLQVFDPSDVLSKEEGCIVICHMGQYTQEIKEQILKINSQVEFV